MKLEKKHYTWIGGIILILAIIAIYMNWDKISSLWKTPSTKTTRVEILDANGTPTGKFVNRNYSPGAISRNISCCSVGNIGFIGGCRYPITSNDHVPPCGNN